MYRDRVELNELIQRRNAIQSQINTITKAETGESYGKLVRELIEKVVEVRLPYASKSVRYKEYTRIHREITRNLNISTQTFTKSEYKEAIKIIETKFRYEIPSAYRCM